MDLPSLIDAARTWRADDPDPVTAAELDALLDAVRAGDTGAAEDLADRFSGLLEFGTAGLRGALGAGPNRMNRAVVVRAAAGLAGWLDQAVPGRQTPRVVVGFDARHRSDDFARDTCAVLAGAGVEAMVLPRPLPTPVLAFAVRYLGCDAGVMVTASHNPPQDNGYKVYLGGRVAPPEGNGVQIVPPVDAEIAAAIRAVPSVTAVPRPADGWHTLGEDVVQAYLDAVVAVLPAADEPQRRARSALSVVLTPLHGVGGAITQEALRRSGFTQCHVVAEQAEPDPDFPTVAFPNPEEPGAVDLALAAARGRAADLVIANDPDADRCAVAVFDPGHDGGAWRMLSGDELGALLGRWTVERLAAGDTASAADQDGAPPAVACSIVSSQLLGRIAAAAGVRHVETLTGFKWIARVPGLAFGYEEAIGYCVAPQVVRDKDGISAALMVAELAAGQRRAGGTLLDLLDDLARRHGVHATDQLSVRVADPALIAQAMARLRAEPPADLAGRPVVEHTDLAEPSEPGLPATDGLRYRTDDGVRVVVRPSGTEPKLKCYLEAVVEVPGDSAADLADVRARATGALRRTREDLQRLLRLG